MLAPVSLLAALACLAVAGALIASDGASAPLDARPLVLAGVLLSAAFLLACVAWNGLRSWTRWLAAGTWLAALASGGLLARAVAG